MSEQATVNIPKDVLEPIVRAQVTAGILKSFGDPTKLIEAVVQRAISQKVNHQGDVDTSEYYNKHDLVEVLATRAIHKIAREMLTDFVELQRPKIEAAFKAAMAKKTGTFAKALVEGLEKSLSAEWKFDCKINLGKE